MKTIVQHYLVAALWSSTQYWGEGDERNDRHFDTDYSISDFSESALKQAEQDIENFISLIQEKTGKDLNEILKEDEQTEERFGHDFWLTRERHGAGFWDGDWTIYGEVLTECAHTFSSDGLYVSDEGKVEFC